MGADLWIIPSGNQFRDGLVIPDNPAIKAVFRIFPTSLHEQVSSIIRERGEFFGLAISPNWPKGRMGIIQVTNDNSVVVGCTALLWWMLEHPDAQVHIILPFAPRWVMQYPQLTVWDYDGVQQS